MKSPTLWRYEARRAGWTVALTPPVAAALFLVLAIVEARTGSTERQTARDLFTVLEMAVPLAAGIGAASLVGRDPAVELQLTVPTPYPVTLLRRLGVTLGWAAAVAVAVAGGFILTGWWARWPAAHGVVAGQLTWLSPTLMLGALGFFCGVVLRSPAAAGAVVGICWIVEELFSDFIQSHSRLRPLYLFATTRGAVPAQWGRNRLTLAVAAAALGAAGWLLLHRTERLVREVAE